MNNILKQADEIVNNRSEEKEREYGPFEDSMVAMKEIFNAMTGLNCTVSHMYQAMIALKLSRQKYKHKDDNLLDCVAYIGAWCNHLNK